MLSDQSLDQDNDSAEFEVLTDEQLFDRVRGGGDPSPCRSCWVSVSILMLRPAATASGVPVAITSPPFIEHHLNGVLESNHIFHWSRDYLLTPFVRAAVIVAFVFLAYPSLFGLRHAPEIGRLLAEESLRLNNLLGILFVCTLLLPPVPPFRKRTELIVPLQGIIATGAVFTYQQ